MNAKYYLGFIVATIIFLSCGNPSDTNSFTNIATTAANASVNSTEGITLDSDGNVIKSANPENRILVHKGFIELETNDTKDYINKLIYNINKHGGHTSNIEIINSKTLKTTQEFNLDSVYNIYEIAPSAHFNMQLPINKADSFVNAIMTMNGTIVRLQLNEDDKTEHYKTNDGIDKAVVNLSSNKEFGIRNTISNTVEKDEIAYQSKYFWCEINVTGTNYINKVAVAKPSKHRTSFYLQALEAIKQGVYWLGQFIVALIYALPIISLVLLGIWLYKKYKFKK